MRFQCSTIGPRRWAGVAAACGSIVLLAGACGDDDATDGAEPGGAAPPAQVSSPADDATVPSAPDPAGTASTSNPSDGDADAAEAVAVDEIELGHSDLGFLVADDEHLWLTGLDGLVVRIDPDDHDVQTVTIAEAAEQLLPSVVADRLWLAELRTSNVHSLDRATLTAGTSIEMPVPSGLVFGGPDGTVWMEATEPPAALLPIDALSATVGEPVAIATGGEVVGSVGAFGSLWVPLYDDATVLRLDPSGTELDRVEVGLGPRLVRAAAGALWVADAIDATITRIDPDDLTTSTVDLDAHGPPVGAPAGVVETGDAIWTRAPSLEDDHALIYRIEPTTGEVMGVRSLPGHLRDDLVGGMAAVGDRLFVLERPTGRLLELDTQQFLDDVAPGPVTTTPATPEELAIRSAVRDLLSSDTSEQELAAGIVDGQRLTDQIADFKQFFADNLPGQAYGGEALAISVDGERARVAFVVTVAGEAIVEPIDGVVVLDEGAWHLTADSFCRLVASGGIECPADLAEP